MKLDFGETSDERDQRLEKWHRWFAWYPVRADAHDWRWLEYVDGCEYRAIQDPPEAW